MTKKQTIAACIALAPDFRMTFERPRDIDTVTVRCTTPDGPLVLSMTLGGLGRAAIETRLLEAALAHLRKTTKNRAA